MTDQNLERRFPFMIFSHDEIESFIRPAFNNNRLVKSAPLTGGKVNSNYQLTLEGPPHIAVLRVYACGQRTCQVERDILLLIEGTVPAPTVLFDGSDCNPPYLIESWIVGTTLDTALADRNNSQTKLGRSAGAALAEIHSHTFPRAALFGPKLSLAHPLAPGAIGYLSIMETYLNNRAADRLGEQLAHELRATIKMAAPYLNDLPDQVCLVHSDFNPANLMISKSMISGVMDWEFCHAGNPLTDIANMLRPRDYQSAAFDDAFICAYEENKGPLPNHWQPLSRLLDLASQVEMLDAAHVRPNLFIWAKERIHNSIDFIQEALITP